MGLAGLVATPAMADRPLNAEERAAAEKALKSAGFSTWEEMDVDDDGPVWEIDDARMKAGGPRYDIKIDPKTSQIIKKELED
jgi:hypothetical protein